MHTENTVTIRAPARTIYDLAADIERWPAILPHYRWVKVLRRGENYRIAEMAARRDLIPVRWRARQELFPSELRITFRHVGGITKGMDVVWSFVEGPEGTTITIRHDLRLGWPLIGGWVAGKIIGPLFVSYIAGKTLRRIKELAETARIEVSG